MPAVVAAAPPRVQASGISMLLSFVAAWVDTLGFVALYGLFTAHVTGNFVLIGATLAHARGGGLIAKLAALPVFVVAVMLTTLFVRRCSRLQRPALPVVLTMQAALLLAFGLVGFLASPIVDVNAPAAVLAGLLGVLAMGIQNGAARLLLEELPPTTVMTGGVTQLSIDAAALLFAPASVEAGSARPRLRKFAPPVVAFAAGAIGGALSYGYFGFIAIVVPALCLLVVVRLVSLPTPAVGVAT